METKICTKCKKEYPATREFFHKHSRHKDGLRSQCKNCRRKYQREYWSRPETKKYEEMNKNKRRDRDLKRKYGISLDVYNVLYNYKNGRCWICGKKEDVLYVDHNHKTGKIRGLLCNKCNSVLGFINDNPLILFKTIEYLKK